MLELEKKLRAMLTEYHDVIQDDEAMRADIDAECDNIVKYVKSKVVESYRNGEKGIKSRDLRKKEGS